MAPAQLKRLASTDRDISPPAKRKIPASATSQTVANFFKPASARIQEPEKVSFRTIQDSCWSARYNAVPHKVIASGERVKLALFDFDDTIVTTASGNRFSRDAQDWKWWNTSVPERLQALHDDGYIVVFISNQAGVKLKVDAKTLKSDNKSLINLRGKVISVLTRLDLPIVMYAATLHDTFRKPRPGMWQALLVDLDIMPEQVDHTQTFFVGDAAGRLGDKERSIRKDHSSSDRDFAANVGINFHTPEEFFLKEPVQPFVRAFDPMIYLQDSTALTEPAAIIYKPLAGQELVLFCGSPGAGKSTFYWTHLQALGFERVNQDLLKTRDRCVQAATRHLEEGKSVAVDNTNADVEVRRVWINLAKKFQVPVRLVHYTASAKLCEHNDTVRALGGELVSDLNTQGALLTTQMNPEHRTMLPKMAFSGFIGRYQPPKLEEGFADITTVDFKLKGSPEQIKIWSQYWIS